MGRKFKRKKYEKKDEKHYKYLDSLIDDAKSYKPEELQIKNAPKPLTSKDLPGRPKQPKLPKLMLPNNVLKSDRVTEPSGRGGKMNRYSVETRDRADIINKFPDANTTGMDKLADFKRSVQGKNYNRGRRNKRLPSSLPPVIAKQGGKPFGKNTSKYAPGVSLGKPPTGKGKK